MKLNIALLSIALFIVGACDMSSTKKPLLSGSQDELFNNPSQLSATSKNKKILIKGKYVHKKNISGHNFSNLNFVDSDLHTFRANQSSLTHAIFTNGSMTGVFFVDSTLTDVVFDGISFKDAVFSGATLVDVTFKNCKFIDSLFMSTKGKVTFIDSDLDSVDFHGAQAKITLINSNVHSTFNPRIETFTDQQPGASIEMTDTTLIDIKIGGILTQIIATGGDIKNSVIGNNIEQVQFDNVYLDLSMVGTINNLIVTNSIINRLAIGEMKINDITIDDCQPSELLSMTDGAYTSLTINNCNITNFKPWSITTGELHITDSHFQNTIMSDSKINQLTLKNVTFENGKFDNARAKETDLSGVKLGGGEFNMAGSNIPLQ